MAKIHIILATLALMALCTVPAAALPVVDSTVTPTPVPGDLPVWPTEFWGMVYINGNGAPAGTVITAYIGGIEYGRYTMSNSVYYGSSETFSQRLKVLASQDEINETITFKVNGYEAEETSTYQPGESVYLILRAPGPVYTGGGGNQNAVTGTETQTPAPPPPPSITDEEGIVTETVVIEAGDGVGSIIVPAGTEAKCQDGMPVINIDMTPLYNPNLPPLPDAAVFEFAGHAYLCGPFCSPTFDPPIQLIFTLSEEEWDQRVGDDPTREFYVKYYNPATGEWMNVLATVDPATRTITADISHFTIYALFVEAGEGTAPPATTMPPAITASTAPPAEFPWIWLLLIAVIIIAAGGYYYFQKKE